MIERSWLKDALDRALQDEKEVTAVEQFIVNLYRLNSKKDKDKDAA